MVRTQKGRDIFRFVSLISVILFYVWMAIELHIPFFQALITILIIAFLAMNFIEFIIKNLLESEDWDEYVDVYIKKKKQP
jgi:hypothetical protein